jgi:hypothetical protein
MLKKIVLRVLFIGFLCSSCVFARRRDPSNNYESESNCCSFKSKKIRNINDCQRRRKCKKNKNAKEHNKNCECQSCQIESKRHIHHKSECSCCSSRRTSNTVVGGVVGAGAGAGIGAAIGSVSGAAGTGALVGGPIGLVAGAIIGNAMTK